MAKRKSLTTIELINRGYLLVNIPSIIIILIVWFGLLAYFEFNGKISAVLGGVLGWIYWSITIKKWIKWALDNNVEPDKLLKIGQMSLLLWNRKIIDKVLYEKKQS